MFYLSSFVICAIHNQDAHDKAATLLEETEDRGWRVTLPHVRDWKTEVADLRLDALYTGVRPVDEH